jgi:putative addiction module component (TIGR02574 family)
MNRPVKQLTLPADLKNLTVGERIRLIEALWDSIVDEQDALGVIRLQREELDRRLELHRASPNEGKSLDEVKTGLEPAP